MSSSKNDFIEKELKNIKSIKRLMIVLSIIFFITSTIILLLNKNIKENALYYMDTSYKKLEQNLSFDQKNITKEEIIKLKENNLLLKEKMMTYKKITYILLLISMVIIIIYFYYMREKMINHKNNLENMVFKDDITGGDTNISFRIKARDVINNSEEGIYSIVLLNINNFKNINRNFGYFAGDNLIKHIYDEINFLLNENEFVCRAEVDNFFICIKANEIEEVENRVKEMITNINLFNENKSIKYRVDFSYGVVFVKDKSIDIKDLMNYARFSCANYKKNKELKNYIGIVELIARQDKLNAMFEDSIEKKYFKVYLQPKINIKTNKCEGAEALVRWIHPKEGLISPAEFIDLFQENNNIIKLDLYVFEEVCKILRKWIDNNVDLVPISVNLSKKHIKNLYFLDDFIAIRDKYKIPYNLIEFEILESLSLEEDEINLFTKVIKEFKDNGFLCDLDDFGFGYSSLACLSKLNVDTIKLDRRFFMDLENKKSREIIEGFIKICRGIDVKVVAEGIETEEQLKYLEDVGCELVQGFVFSKAIDVDSFEKSFLI